MQKLISFFKFNQPDFYFSPIENAKFNLVYLIITILLLVGPVVTFFYFRTKKDRPNDVYSTFDKLWFWTYFSLGWLGLFIWFARTQGLPLFGTRVASYSYLLVILLPIAPLIWYYKKKIPGRIEKHYEKARKSKYLKQKK